MARPLIATKLHVPRPRRGLVERPRLRAQLDRGTSARLVLVSAPAGFGKTTLLGSWLAAWPPSSAARAAWVSLDPSDRDPVRFWSTVAAALRTAVPAVGSRTLELLDGRAPAVAEALDALLNDLATVEEDLWLLLDDHHLVASPDLDAQLATVLEHLPTTVHVVLSTRHDPDLPLPRLRGRGELVELRSDALRFTAEEAGTFLTGTAGLTLDPAAVSTLGDRTEGWPAALQLAALSLDGRQDVEGFISGFAGTDRHVVDYLVQEVLDQQTPEVRTFLLQTSVLDRLGGDLCDTVTGSGGSSRRLEQLERANLFVVALDDHREWYRYHHLFADVLRARLAEVRSAADVAQLHARAAAWYADADRWEEAVHHGRQAEDIDAVADLVERALPWVRRHREDVLLRRWLADLPDAVVRERPALATFDAYGRLATGELDAVAPLLDIAESRLGDVPPGMAGPWADTVELRRLATTITTFRGALAQARGDAAEALGHARSALDMAAPDDHLARGAAAGILGLSAWAADDLPTAIEAFGPAVEALAAAGNLLDAVGSAALLADMWVAVGRAGRARTVLDEALQRAAENDHPVPSAIARVTVTLADLDREAGDLAGATSRLEAAAELGGGAPPRDCRHRWHLTAARVAAAEGRWPVAMEELGRAEEAPPEELLPMLRSMAAIRARIQVAAGDVASAAAWAGGSGLTTAGGHRAPEHDLLTLVRVRLAEHRTRPSVGRLDGLDALLDRLAVRARRAGRRRSVVEIGMLQALLHQASGRDGPARQALAAALAEAPEPGALARLFLDEGPAMLALLRDAHRHGVGGMEVERLRRMAEGGAEPSPTTPALGTAVPLSERELDVLRLLAGDLSGPEIARALHVSVNTLRTHTRHVYEKLQVGTRRAAVRRAREMGLL